MTAIYEMEEAPLTTDIVIDDLEDSLLGVTFTNQDGRPVYPVNTKRIGSQIILEMSDGTSFTVSCAYTDTP